MQVENGTPANQIAGAHWRKSEFSNPNGSCVEVAGLPDGAIAMRNSRYPSGPALVYTQAEITAFVLGVKNGEFDNLIASLGNRRLGWRTGGLADHRLVPEMIIGLNFGLGQRELPGDIVLEASAAG